MKWRLFCDHNIPHLKLILHAIQISFWEIENISFEYCSKNKEMIPYLFRIFKKPALND